MGIFEDQAERIKKLMARRAQRLKTAKPPVSIRAEKAALEARPRIKDPRTRKSMFRGERGPLPRRQVPGIVRPGVKPDPKPKDVKLPSSRESISTAGQKPPPEPLKERVFPPVSKASGEIEALVSDMSERLLRKLTYGLLSKPPFTLGRTQTPDLMEAVNAGRYQWFYSQLPIPAFSFVTFMTAPKDTGRALRWVRLTANNASAVGAIQRWTPETDGNGVVENIASFGLGHVFDWTTVIPSDTDYIIGPRERICLGNLGGTEYIYHLSCFFVDIPSGMRPKKGV